MDTSAGLNYSSYVSDMEQSIDSSSLTPVKNMTFDRNSFGDIAGLSNFMMQESADSQISYVGNILDNLEESMNKSDSANISEINIPKIANPFFNMIISNDEPNRPTGDFAFFSSNPPQENGLKTNNYDKSEQIKDKITPEIVDSSVLDDETLKEMKPNISNIFSTTSLQDFNTSKSNFNSKFEEHSPTNKSKENFTFGAKSKFNDSLTPPKNSNKLVRINLSKIRNSNLKPISEEGERERESITSNIKPLVLDKEINQCNKISERKSIDDILDSLNIAMSFSQDIGPFKRNKQ